MRFRAIAPKRCPTADKLPCTVARKKRPSCFFNHPRIFINVLRFQRPVTAAGQSKPTSIHSFSTYIRNGTYTIWQFGFRFGSPRRCDPCRRVGSRARKLSFVVDMYARAAVHGLCLVARRPFTVYSKQRGDSLQPSCQGTRSERLLSHAVLYEYTTKKRLATPQRPEARPHGQTNEPRNFPTGSQPGKGRPLRTASSTTTFYSVLTVKVYVSKLTCADVY